MYRDFSETEEEPRNDGSIFVCFLCEKEFTEVQDLNNHMKTHGDPIVCHVDTSEVEIEEDKKSITLMESKDYEIYPSLMQKPIKHETATKPHVVQKKKSNRPKTTAEIMAQRALKVQKYIQSRENKSVKKVAKEEDDGIEMFHSTTDINSMSGGTVIMSEPEGFVCPKQSSHSKFHMFSVGATKNTNTVQLQDEDEVNFFSEGSASKYTSSRVNIEDGGKNKRGRPPHRQKPSYFDRDFEDGNFLTNQTGRRSGVAENDNMSHNCLQCHKEFRSVQTLKVHLKSHEEPKVVICPMCEASFPQRHILYEHIVNDHEECLSELVCSVCSKIFTRTDSLKSHMMRMHNRNGGLNCMICSKNFPSQAQLEIHVRVHTGERPFRCIECDRGFVQKVHLKTHLRTMHNISDPPATPCRLCLTLLDNKTNLRDHYILKHGMSTQQYRMEVMRLRREGKIPEKIPPTVKVVSPNFTYRSVSTVDIAHGSSTTSALPINQGSYKKTKYRSNNLTKIMNANDDIMFSPDDIGGSMSTRNEDELKFVESAFKVAEEMDLMAEGNSGVIIENDEASNPGIYYTLPVMMDNSTSNTADDLDISSDEISPFDRGQRVRVVMAEPLEDIDADASNTVEMLSM